ncbi:MAG: hypothetical protein H0X40_13610 [Chthoniobacterales bacterium]|nr:hypothetical protein [Chthoniobacterales bacterium]
MRPSNLLPMCAAAAALLSLLNPAARASQPGDLDPTFGGGDGKVLTDLGGGSSDYGLGAAMQTDGKIIVVGFSGIYPGANASIARHNSDGTLDPLFGNGGTVISHFSTTDSFTAVAVQPDGKIVAVGAAAATSGNYGTDFLIARYSAAGSLDNSFGVSGATVTKLRGNIPEGWYFSASAQDIVLLPDGKILVAGQTTTVAFGRMALLRYNSDGSLDQSYGQAGVVTVEFPVGPNGVNGGVSAFALAQQSDGKSVLAGSYVDNGFSEFALARINADGSPDTTFGTNGQVTSPIKNGDAVALDVLLQSDGKIVAGGYFQAGLRNRDFALMRYNSNGTLDTTFGRRGTVTNDLSDGTDDAITGLMLQADNKIVAGGQSGHYPSFDFGLARYTTSGRVDKTFGRKGSVTTDFGQGSFDIAYGLLLTPDGKIVLAGESNGANGQDFDFALSRYLAP